MSQGRGFDQILQRPVVSEKSYDSMATGVYIFRCVPDATKVEIRHAVEEAFSSQKISVVAVNTMRVDGKSRRRSRGSSRISGKSPDWKKAIVTLAPGQKIEGLFEGV